LHAVEDVPMPYHENLQSAALPGVATIAEKIDALLSVCPRFVRGLDRSYETRSGEFPCGVRADPRGALPRERRNERVYAANVRSLTRAMRVA